MSLYRRPDSPVWWSSFLSGGRRVRRSTGSADRKAAETIATGWRAGDAATAPSSGMTLSAALGRYTVDHAQNLPSKATIGYQGSARTSGP